MSSNQVGVSEVMEKNESPCHSQLAYDSLGEEVDVSPQQSLIADSSDASGEHILKSQQDAMQPKEFNEGKETASLQLPKVHLDQRDCRENSKAPGEQTMNTTITKEASATRVETTTETDKDGDISACEKNAPPKKSVTRRKSSDKQQGKNSMEEGDANLVQQNLMEESGKMMEYLRQEVLRMRSDNASLRNEMETMTDNTKRLTEANSAARASFAALNEHAVAQRDNAIAASEDYEKQIQELKMACQEMKDELQMKHNAYISEFRSRLNYEEAMSRIIDTLQERCRDSRLVEDILQITDELEEQKHKGEEEGVLEALVPEKSNEQSNMVGRLTSFFSSY